jgi:hypothetical protein
MLDGVNDTPAQAKALVNLVKNRLPVKFNLIPFNPFPESGLKRSSDARVRAFGEVLLEAGLVTTIRKTRGDDIDAACGQLAGEVQDRGADPAPFTAALRHANGPVEQNLSLPASSGAGLPRGRVSVPLGSSPRRRSWLWGVAAVIVAVIALAMWHTGGDSAAWFARLKASANGATQATNSETSASSSVAATDEATANTGSVASGDAAMKRRRMEPGFRLERRRAGGPSLCRAR